MVQFNPPLSSAVTVTIPSTLSLGSLLCLHATLSRDEFASLQQDDIKIQVWSNFGTDEWSETTFEDETKAIVDGDDFQADTDISLIGDSPAKDLSSEAEVVQLVATTPLPPLAGRTVEFTYRLMYASGEVKWLGSEGTNGRIFVERTDEVGFLKAEDWSGEEDGVYSFKVPAGSNSVVVAKLGGDTDWRGWAIGEEGPSRFTTFSSAVTERVALALLPRAHPGAHATFKPLLYHTTGDATLSLTDSGEIHLHPGDVESVLHASISTPTWRTAVNDKATTLDLRTPQFLGVSFQNNSNMGSVHFLPLSSLPAVVTVNCAELKSLVSSAPNVALIAPTSLTATFLKATSSDLRVAVGPGGGEIFVLPVFSLQGNRSEWSMVFLPHGSGSITAVATDTERTTHPAAAPSSNDDTVSESTLGEESPESEATMANGHPNEQPAGPISEELLLIVVQLVRFLLQLFGGSIPAGALPAISKSREEEQAPLLPTLPKEEPAKEQPVPRLAFNVTGKHTLVMKGGDVSKINLTLDGNALKVTPQALDKGNWSIVSEAGVRPAQLEVALHE